VRTYRTIVYKDAKLRVACPRADVVERELVRQRELLEAYIRRQPEFLSALAPIRLLEDAPEIARRMDAASQTTGVGPMAAVAGAMAEACARAALEAGAREAIVENGGDLYASSPEPVVIGIHAGRSQVSGRLAFSIPPELMPLSLCSSSSTMGHSLSFGDCDLATIVSKDAALADAAATLACNSVKSAADFDRVLSTVSRIPGVLGLLLVKGDDLAMCGELPPIVKADPADTAQKVTRF
jgi:ApbE superfamily uncharacterized protein (UPF0280 family)